MDTTLGETAADVAVQFGVFGSACWTGGASVPRPRLEEELAAEEDCASSDPSWVAA
jgi:hypothetical protein